MINFYSKSTNHLMLSVSLTALISTGAFVPGITQASIFDLEEIVITAQKREQSLQDVGISVTAYTGAQLKQLGMGSAIDLVAQSPGVEVSGAGGGAINSFSIRGVTQNDFSPAQESPVAVYIDEAYISQNTVSNFSLFDIERVEVLRGPQGTLFGRNATGGLLHYLTVKPSHEAEGFFEAQLGEDGREKIEVAMGGELTDTMAARLSAIYNKSDGLIENDIGPDLMAADDYSIRAQLLFDPTSDLSILLKAQYAKEDSVRGGYGHSVAEAGEFSVNSTATDFFGYRDVDGDPYTVSNDFAGFSKAEVSDVTAKIEWDVGEYTLTSVTNYQDIKSGYSEDADASPNSVYNYVQYSKVQQYSQEFRLSWDSEKTYNMFGLYYLKIDGDYTTDQFGDLFFGPGFVYSLAAQQDTETLALFGQTEITLTDSMALTIGARLNYDEKKFSFDELGANIYESSFSDDDFSARIQLDYRPNENWLLYAGINRGIKSGGFNLPLAPISNDSYAYGGEVLTAFEAGFKAELGDVTRLNVSIFHYKYDDYQAYSFDNFVAILFNANAEMTGGEIELVTTPVEGLDIMVGVAMLDSEVTDVPLAVSPTGTEEGVLSPELSINGLVRYAWTAFGGTIAVQADYSWKDDHKFNLAVTPVIEEGDYGILNASVRYTSDDDSWYGSFFVRNLTGEEYRRFALDTTAFFGSTEDVLGDERWAGVSAGYRW